MKVKDLVRKIKNVNGNIPIVVNYKGEYKKLGQGSNRDSYWETFMLEFSDESIDTEWLKHLIDYYNKLEYISLFDSYAQFLDYSVEIYDPARNVGYTATNVYVRNINGKSHFVFEIE